MANTEQGNLTDEEYEILRCARERMKNKMTVDVRKEQLQKTIENADKYLSDYELVGLAMDTINGQLDACLKLTGEFSRSLTFCTLCEVSGHLQAAMCHFEREVKWAQTTRDTARKNLEEMDE